MIIQNKIKQKNQSLLINFSFVLNQAEILQSLMLNVHVKSLHLFNANRLGISF